MANKLKMTVISGAPGGVPLDQEIQRQLELARQCVLESSLKMPTCTIWTAHQVLVVSIPVGGDEEKAFLKKQLRRLVNGVNAHTALMVSEAWIHDMKHPNATIIGEAILITARNAHENLLATQKFTRNADGTITFEPSELRILDDSEVRETWFAGCKFVA
jgi:hypothetical protein